MESPLRLRRLYIHTQLLSRVTIVLKVGFYIFLPIHTDEFHNSELVTF